MLQTLLCKGYDVIALRRSPRAETKIRLDRQPRWIECNLLDVKSSDLQGVDQVVHIASAGVMPKNASLSELLSVNVHGSANLVEQAYYAGVERFVVAGSCMEYGASARRFEHIPADAPLEPIGYYAASKAAAFQLLSAYSRQHDLFLYYGRIFHAYGEGQWKENFWPSLRRAAVSGLDFPMTTGHQIRDFISVEDVAEQFCHACIRTDIRAGIPLVENIGTGIPTRLLEFARHEWEILGATGTLQIGAIPNRPHEEPRIVADVPTHSKMFQSKIKE